MTTLLGKVTVAGQIRASERNTVSGWLQLADKRHPVALQLTGNVPEQLLGLQVEFRSSDFLDWEAEDDATVPRDQQESSLDSHQVGALYDFGFDCDIPISGDDAVELSCVHVWLEWAGQQGRLRVDLADAYVRVGPSHVLEASETRQAEVDEPANNPREFGELASSWDRIAFESVVRGGMDEALERHFELIDEMVDGDHDVPIQSIFDPPLKLLPAERVADDAIDSTVLDLLARLARYGIALDVCPHFTPRQVYQLILDVILKSQIYPKLRETGFVQHYMTCEFCPECQADAP